MSVTLYCYETPGLKLGPNGAEDPDTIKFIYGYATIETLTPEIERWINAPGTPHIEILDAAEGRVADGTAGSENCPECRKAFATKRQLQGHLMSHRR